MYAIEYAEGVQEDLKNLPAGVRREMVRVMSQQLSHQPAQVTRNRKPLPGFQPPWLHRPPVWELRIREYRVYYDVDEAAEIVIARCPPQTASPNHGGGCMKVTGIEETRLDECVRQARRQAVVLTRRGKPVAVMFGVTGMDLEQIELSLDCEFWKIIDKRRKEPTIAHEELLRRLEEWDEHNAAPPRKKKGTA